MKLMKTVLALLLAANSATAAQQADPKFEELSRLVTQKMAEYHVPGVAFGIVKNGQVMVRGFGVTNIEDPQPVTGDTVFPIASISKTIAAQRSYASFNRARWIRNLALAIFTNHNAGWRLIQDVERAALKLYEGVSLDPKQAIGHRGVNETMPDVPLLLQQPAVAEYVGVYKRTPVGDVQVRQENGRLMIGETVLGFYAPDRAVATTGNNRGNPYEFIRKPDGTVGWIRVVGRIARKE